MKNQSSTSYLSLMVMAVMLIATTNLTAQNDNSAKMNQEMQTFESYKDIGYDQVLRPQFHFTSLKNWHNDPNGMVWYDGEYHL